MAVIAVIGLVALLALIFGPSLWISHVLKVHGAERPEARRRQGRGDRGRRSL
jgi:hypothetical protein